MLLKDQRKNSKGFTLEDSITGLESRQEKFDNLFSGLLEKWFLLCPIWDKPIQEFENSSDNLYNTFQNM